jgi:hypothetical protein
MIDFQTVAKIIATHCCSLLLLLLPTLQSGSLAGLVRRLLLLEAVGDADSSSNLISVLLLPGMRGAWQDQQQLNLAQLDGMQINSSSSSSSSCSSGIAGVAEAASADDDAASAAVASAGRWILHDMINLLLMRSFIESIDSMPTASDSTAASSQYSNKHSTAYNGARAAAAAAADGDAELLQAAEALQDSKLRQHLRSCLGPRCCVALTCWVLLWHCSVEEAGGDYSCAKTR